MPVRPAQVVLENMKDAIDWQCAHEASAHREPKRRIYLTYEVPGGDRTYHVTAKGKTTIIRRTL